MIAVELTVSLLIYVLVGLVGVSPGYATLQASGDIDRAAFLRSAALLEERVDSVQEPLDRVQEEMRLGRFQNAVALLKTLLAEDPGSAQAHMLLGVALRSLGSHEFLGEAQAELRQALLLDPELHWARFALARIYLDLGRDTRAREELEAGLKGLPGQPLFLSFLGEAYRRLGQPQRSLALSEQALTGAPDLSIARFHRALAWRDLERPDTAVRELEAGLRSEPVLPEMLHTLGALYLQTGKTRQAISILERAVALDPASAEGHLQLARAHLRQQQPDEALERVAHAWPAGREVLSSAYFQNLEAEVHFVRGEAYWMKGLKEAALEAYGRAVEIEPDHREARDRLDRLHRSRDSAERSDHP